MPEPRFDFCLIVIREHRLGGFVLKCVCMAYVPELPQQKHLRDAWLRKKTTFESVAYQMKGIVGDVSLHWRSDKTPVGSLHLWAIVPVLRVTDERIIKLVQYEKDFGLTDMRIFNETEIHVLRLTNFFRRLCADFNKVGGGKWILERNKKEVLKNFM